MKKTNKTSDPSSLMETCTICGKEYKSGVGMANHLRFSHPGKQAAKKAAAKARDTEVPAAQSPLQQLRAMMHSLPVIEKDLLERYETLKQSLQEIDEELVMVRQLRQLIMPRAGAAGGAGGAGA